MPTSLEAFYIIHIYERQHNESGLNLKSLCTAADRPWPTDL